MNRSERKISFSGMVIAIMVFANAIVLSKALTTGTYWYGWLVLTVPLLIIAIADVLQQKHAIKRNFPVIGHLRYLFEKIRPELRQYFFESDLDGKPFSRRQRAIVYQRAKNEKQTVAFGMQTDPKETGYEWVSHSIYPVKLDEKDLRITVGNYQCLQPYSCSIYNIGAMSYGALSKTAISSLNEGAALGGFAHNTGEGGISEHHLKGGDLIWQIGTGYFGCRNEHGRFNAMAFRKNAMRPTVKMIELKLSQGAKPGHGGILPAAKNTEEIAAIRGVQSYTTVHSPSAHSEFNTPEGLVLFLQLLRELSDGKPVGFKLCIGEKDEFVQICKAIRSTGYIPDFISVDGAEGGTGAAPLEFTDHLGMPLYDALAFVSQTLEAHGLAGHIKVFAAGKIITGFDILKALSLGADACYSARGMMLALGCIQALVCDSGKCPAGVATQNPALYKGLVPSDKRVRVASFHNKTIAATKEMMEACGFKNISDVQASRFYRRINQYSTQSFEEIYFPLEAEELKIHLNKQLN